MPCQYSTKVSYAPHHGIPTLLFVDTEQKQAKQVLLGDFILCCPNMRMSNIGTERKGKQCYLQSGETHFCPRVLQTISIGLCRPFHFTPQDLDFNLICKVTMVHESIFQFLSDAVNLPSTCLVVQVKLQANNRFLL